MKNILAERGIDAEAKKLGWVLKNGTAWEYPLWREGGETHPARRWKAVNSDNTPKYLWLNLEAANHEKPLYYFAPGWWGAAINNDATLYIASGEPDVLTLRSAGILNAICWFGERAIPATLAEDLNRWGIKTIYYYPDLDETGRAAAAAIRDMLPNDIEFDCRELPAALGPKGDLNVLWKHVNFNRVEFITALANCPPLKLETKPQSVASALQNEDRRKRLIAEGALNRAVSDIRAAVSDRNNTLAAKARWIGSFVGAGVLTQTEAESALTEAGLACGLSASEVRATVAGRLKKGSGDSVNWDEFDLIDRNSKSKSPAARIVSYDDAKARVRREIENNEVIGSNKKPILMPFRQIAALGGLAQIIPRRKVIGVIAGSGVGKTSFLESLACEFRRKGYNLAMWGPEWSPEEYIWRLIGAYGGPSLTKAQFNRLFLIEENEGIAPEKRDGRALTPEEKRAAVHILDFVDTWPGKIYWIDSGGATIKTVTESVDELIDKQKIDISIPIYDYVQLLEDLDNSEATNAVSANLRHIKKHTSDRDLVTFVSSQIRKTDQLNASDLGALVGQNSLLSGRDDSFNLTIGLSMQRQGSNIMTVDHQFPEDSESQAYQVGIANVAKNSLGKVGPVEILRHPRRNRWMMTSR